MTKRVLMALALTGLMLTGSVLQAADAVLLRPKWQVGRRYTTQLETTQEILLTLTPGSQPMAQTGTHAFEVALSALKTLPDGGVQLELEYVSVSMRMEMGGRVMTYDSTQPAETNAASPFSVLSTLVGAKVVCDLDADGQVSGVRGVKELADRIGGQNPQAKQLMDSVLSADGFKKQFSGAMGLNWLPKTPVKVGDTWSDQDEVAMGMMGTFLSKMTYTFEGWEKKDDVNCAVLTYTGTMASEPADPVQQSGVSMSMAIKNGKLSGRTLFDPKAGIVLGSTLNTDADMQITMAGFEGSAPRTMVQKLKQTNTVTLTRVEDL